MNIFLPYEDSVERSVQSLDDLRLNKQILECYQLLSNAIKEKNGGVVVGYKNHPIYAHYKGNIPFLANYGYQCCMEFMRRFDKVHSLHPIFLNYNYQFNSKCYNGQPEYVPFYMEGSKDSPNCIRTTENVSELYQKKLIDKWDTDKAKGRNPKWTNRGVPEFYSKTM